MKVEAVTLQESAQTTSIPAKQPAPAVSFRDVLSDVQASSSAELSRTDTRPATYTVRKGDSLWKICKAELQAAGRDARPHAISASVARVAAANGIANPDRIIVGQRIDLSALGARAKNGVVSSTSTSPATRSKIAAPPLRPRADSTALAAGGPGNAVRAASRVRDLSGIIQSLLNQGSEPAKTVGMQYPLRGPVRVVSSFGMRNDPFTGRRQHHDGIDLAAVSGAQIYPAQAGRVVFSGWQGGYGRVIIVDHGNGLRTVYSHNSRNLATLGSWVSPDNPIALVGSTGRSTGAHLHFEVRKHGRPVDPMPFLNGPSLKVAQAS